MRDIVRTISENISKIYNSNTLNMAQALQNNITTTLPIFSNLYENKELINSIREFQSVQQSYKDLIPKIDIPDT